MNEHNQIEKTMITDYLQEESLQVKKKRPDFHKLNKDEKIEETYIVPKGNGGTTQKYIWTQTLQDLDLFVYLNPEVTKKNIKVVITPDSLHIVVKGIVLINSKWKHKVNIQNTYWIIEDDQIYNYHGKYMHINVDKLQTQTSWWSSPLHGDAQINTQMIIPEPKQMQNLDVRTRSTVEGGMFDVRLKKQRLSSIEEQQNRQKLKEFMKMHPEMDFSKCKFN